MCPFLVRSQNLLQHHFPDHHTANEGGSKLHRRQGQRIGHARGDTAGTRLWLGVGLCQIGSGCGYVVFMWVSFTHWRLSNTCGMCQGYDIRVLITFGPPNAAEAFRAHPLRLVQAQVRPLGV